MCAKMAVILHEQHHIVSCETARVNWKGWPKERMVLPENEDKGTDITSYDYGI